MTNVVQVPERAVELVTVTPVQGGWRVESSAIGEPLMFLSGGRAEKEARTIAGRLSELGHEARVVIHDRRNGLAGILRFARWGRREG